MVVVEADGVAPGVVGVVLHKMAVHQEEGLLLAVQTILVSAVLPLLKAEGTISRIGLSFRQMLLLEELSSL